VFNIFTFGKGISFAITQKINQNDPLPTPHNCEYPAYRIEV